jgi:hypothetical protein
VKLGVVGKPPQIDVNDSAQCTKFNDEVVAKIKEAFVNPRKESPKDNRLYNDGGFE